MTPVLGGSEFTVGWLVVRGLRSVDTGRLYDPSCFRRETLGGHGGEILGGLEGMYNLLIQGLIQ